MPNIIFYSEVYIETYLEVLFMATYHFIGIKGTGMSALAHILHDSGEKVQGSDVEKRFFTQDEIGRAHV